VSVKIFILSERTLVTYTVRNHNSSLNNSIGQVKFILTNIVTKLPGAIDKGISIITIMFLLAT